MVKTSAMPDPVIQDRSKGYPGKNSPAKKDDGLFLKLFMAQIKNQNPLDPMKPAEVTKQVMSFSIFRTITEIDNKIKILLDNILPLLKDDDTGNSAPDRNRDAAADKPDERADAGAPAPAAGAENSAGAGGADTGFGMPPREVYE